MTRTEKEQKVMSMLMEHGISKEDAEMAVNETWSEQELDEFIGFSTERVAKIAQEMKDLPE